MIPVPTKLRTDNFILTVEFADGQVRQIDARTFFGKGGRAEEVKNSKAMFDTAFIEDELSITWKNGFSVDPDIIYEDGEEVKALPAVSMTQKIISRYKKEALILAGKNAKKLPRAEKSAKIKSKGK